MTFSEGAAGGYAPSEKEGRLERKISRLFSHYDDIVRHAARLERRIANTALFGIRASLRTDAYSEINALLALKGKKERILGLKLIADELLCKMPKASEECVRPVLIKGKSAHRAATELGIKPETVINRAQKGVRAAYEYLMRKGDAYYFDLIDQIDQT